MARSYVTVQGDMWDSIAHKQLGSARHTGSLMLANRQHREIYIFPAGIVLTLPEVRESASGALPPWKRRME
jgi:phage tail protein X